MCQICALWNLGKMKAQEVDKAMAEVLSTSANDSELQHAQDVIAQVEKALDADKKS